MSQVDARRSVVNALGRRIQVLGDDPRGDALIAAGGDFNPGSLAMWAQVVGSRLWELVIDVGANYGEMLLGVDMPPAARVVAFEPDDQVRACLESSLREAGLDVELRAEAVGAAVGEAEYLIDPTWSGTSVLAEVAAPTGDRQLRHTRVPITTLDAAFLSTTVTTACIKIDVEGAEDLVLAGGSTFFRRLQDLAIMIEILHRSAEELLEWATAWRMYMYDVRAGQLVRVLPGDVGEIERLLSLDWIYRQDVVLRPRSVR